jgi:hypothetical protein
MISFIKTYLYGLLLSLIFIGLGSYSALEIVDHTANYQENMRNHVKVLNFKDRLFNAEEWTLLFVEKAFDFVDDYQWGEKEQEAVLLLLKAEDEYTLALNKSIEIGVAAFCLLFIVFLIHLKSNLRKQLIIPIFSVCAIFLFLGIMSPMLEISASNTDLKIPIALDLSSISSPIEKGLELFDELTGMETAKSNIPADFKTSIQFKGKMYFYYQSKSVYQLIILLFKDKNMLVGTAILLFSLVIPILKLLLTLVLGFSNQQNSKLNKVVSYLGKWSMADVFVASCFLAFLSFSNMNVGIDTESKILFGLYFFFSYVLLSIVMSSLVKKSVS